MTAASPTPVDVRREETLGAGAIIAWLCGAAVASRHGIWIGVGCAAIFLGAGLVGADRARFFALLRPNPRRLLVGLAAGVAMAVATLMLYPVAATMFPAIRGETRGLYAAFARLSPLASSLVLGPVIVGEEIVWRGAVHGVLVRRMGPYAAVVVGAVVYAGAHAPVGSPLLVLVALACGVVWGVLRAVTGSLIPGLVCHLVWDATILIVFPLTT